MLDTKTMNREFKMYLQTLMRDLFQNYVQELIQGIFKTSLEDCSTTDCFRNRTMQELTDVLKEQSQEQLVNPLRNEESAGEQLVTRLLKMLKRDVKSSGVCAKTVKDCTEMQKLISDTLSGVYTIHPDKSEVKVYCDMTTDGGGWTIIQRRLDGSVNFERQWTYYENGFGNDDGEYWIGNKHIHSLTSSGRYELRIDLADLSNTKKYAVYNTFVVGDAESTYRLTVGGYSGNAGDAMDDQNGSKFYTTGSCTTFYGPWWHSSCGDSGLNQQFSNNLKWRSSSTHETKGSVMMIRKLQ